MRLARTQTSAGRANDALEAVEALRKLPPLERDDPRSEQSRGEEPDSSDNHDSGEQVAATSSETTPATAPVISASLLPAANLSFRPPVSLTDTANLDHAALNEKWPHGNQQAAAMLLGREEVQPMGIRNLTLFTLMLACLTHPALSLGQDSKSQPSDEILRESKPTDFNGNIYYKNKLEFSLETGWLPINIPWPFDFLLGDQYNQTPLKYTLVPTIASLRWQIDDVGGPWILRGNWDLTFSGAFTAIPRGPETHYEAFDTGIRRNFVRPNWRIVPYFDLRLGLGRIDAKGPQGVPYAQGQDFTFTFMMGSGVRYNFNSRYAISAGINFMHVSDLYLSEPKVRNYGINVYGPMVGVDIRLGKPKRESAQ